MKKHHLILKEKQTGEIFYHETDLEVYAGILSLTRTPEQILELFKNALPDFEIIGEKLM